MELTQKQRLALQVIDLGKALLLADNHFLSAAVGRLQLQPAEMRFPFATDGYALYFDDTHVLQDFKRDEAAPKRDLLHSVMHCVFLHPYVNPAVEQGLWSLACDIAVEHAVLELCGQRSGACGNAIAFALARIERDLGCRPTAEKVYSRLCEGMWENNVEAWRALFTYDEHAGWYAQPDPDSEGDEQVEGKSNASGAGGKAQQQSASGQNAPQGAGQDEGTGQDEAAGSGGGEDEGSQQPSASAGSGGEGEDLSKPGEAPENRAGQQPAPGKPGQQDARYSQGSGAGNLLESIRVANAGRGLREISRPSVEMQQAEWRQIATSLAVNLQTMSAKRGQELSGFVDELEMAAHKRMDYADFLRQFAISGEVMRTSDDEFDYIFYTYGLKLYGNLPLIEPLEYREEKRVREFVLVIDTSGSVQGEIVRRFIEATFDILKSTESFFQRVNLRIIQCDAAVQSDDKITSLEELREWGNSMKVIGQGGTDFRPAFEYVDKLVEDGEFENLGGLVYFTDGFGTYPGYLPSYRSAFVFYDEGYRAEDVPPWAVQIVLDKDAIAQGASFIGR